MSSLIFGMKGEMMALAQICRVEKDKNYTTMGNFHLRDRDLSLKAKGLLSVVLSLPPDWDYSIAGLVAIVKEKETVVRSCLKELKEVGYLVVKKETPTKENGGHFNYIYIFYEKSQLLDHKTKNSICENLDVEVLDVEVLDVENQRQINTNILSKEKLSKEKGIVSKETSQKPKKQTEEDIPLKGDSRSVVMGKVDESTKKGVKHEPNPPSVGDPPSQKKVNKKEIWEQEFEEIWQYCPNKRGKADGKKAYVRARKNKVSKEVILEGMKKYAERVRVEKIPKQYIRQGGNWFKGERWEDEVVSRTEEYEIEEDGKENDDLLDFLKFSNYN